jgi:hypothetical protein
MKRKSLAKLQLSKETLSRLEDKDVSRAAGGTVADTACLACPTNHTRVCSICCP